MYELRLFYMLIYSISIENFQETCNNCLVLSKYFSFFFRVCLNRLPPPPVDWLFALRYGVSPFQIPGFSCFLGKLQFINLSQE